MIVSSFRAPRGLIRATLVVVLASIAADGARAADEPRTPVVLPAQADVKPVWTPPRKPAASEPRVVGPRIDAVVPPAARAPRDVQLTASRTPRPPHDGLGFDERGSELWARGRDYKASFDPRGFTFVPFLGSDAPRNFPVTCTLSSVTIGERLLVLQGSAGFVRSDRTIARDLGPVTEVYALDPGGVEQSFVLEFARSPGDAVVRLAVCTELAALPIEGGVRFANALGGVDCRAAFAVDARGRRIELPIEWAGASIGLRVPESFLQDAAWPVTIDPLWSTFWVDTFSIDSVGADASHDASQDTWIVVFEDVFSGSDSDVYSVVFDLSGNPIHGEYVDLTAEHWTHPRVANNGNNDQYLVVAAVSDLPAGASSIRGRTTLANWPLYSPVIVISGAEAGDKVDPVVGGDPVNVAPSYYCVVWSRVAGGADRDVHARLVDPSGALVGGGTILLDNTLGTLDTVPAISKSDGAPPFVTQEWNVVWQRRFAVGDEDVYGAQLHWNGVITTPPFAIDVSASDDTHPTVSTLLEEPIGTRPYLVAWERDYGTDHDIVGRVFDGAAQVAYVNLSVTEGVYYLFDQLEPSAESDGEEFVVAYVQDTAPDYDPLVATLHLVGTEVALGEGIEWLTASNDEQRRPQLASARSVGASRARCIVVYDSDDGVDRDIQAALYDAVPYARFCDPATPSVADCPCGNTGSPGHGCASSSVLQGGLLVATGLSDPDSIVLHGSFMPATSTCIYLQGDALANAVFGDGVLCAGGTNIRLRTRTNAAGASEFPIAGDPSVSTRGLVTPGSGERRFYQTYYRNAAAFCTAATFNVTNGVQVVW